MKSKLFVYGTLMKDSSHEMAAFLFENTHFIGEAYIRGELFNISWYPGAVYNERSQHKVYGELYELENEQVLIRLDAYEGVGDDFSTPNEYARILATVYVGEVQHQAWVYHYQLPTDFLHRIVSGKFLS